MLPTFVIPFLIGTLSLGSAAVGAGAMASAADKRNEVERIGRRLKEYDFRVKRVSEESPSVQEALGNAQFKNLAHAARFLKSFNLLYKDAQEKDGDLLEYVGDYMCGGFPGVIGALERSIENAAAVIKRENPDLVGTAGTDDSWLLGLVGSVPVGASTVFALQGIVGAVGTASTGTAISTLSGAAAANATLAWFGGGSLATGGLGMAGGAAVLGMAAAGPALLFAGISADSASSEALEEAEKLEKEMFKNLPKLKRGKEFIKVAKKYIAILNALDPIYEKKVSKLEGIIEYKGCDYDLYSRDEMFVVKKCMELSATAAEIFSNPVLNQNDEGINPEAYKVIERHSSYL